MILLKKGRLPIKIWAEKSDLIGYEDAIEQAVNLSNHVLARKWIVLMPDFHVGYGMPIGGVLAAKSGVIPNAVGVDIGCGMIAAQTNLNSNKLARKLLEDLRFKIHEKIPVGFKHHSQPRTDPIFIQPIDEPIINTQLEKARYQIGTLGGGNHFIEIQQDQRGFVWIMIHTGSRNLGKKVADYYHKIALDYTQCTASVTKDLAYIPRNKPEYKMYLKAMQYCLKFAETNRELILNRILDAFRELGFNLELKQKIQTHHNFAAVETHYSESFLIHRKGAIRAEGLVTIPGSMGTYSYICQGLKPAESFNSCSHGAGRMISRHKANKKFTYEQAVESMRHVVFHIRHGEYDELPMVYKDIDRIIKLQKDLVKPVYKLSPLAVAKG